MAQFVYKQRIELRRIVWQWQHDPAAMRLRRRDLVAGGVLLDLFQRHRSGRRENHERYLPGKNEVQALTDVVVRSLGASHDAIEIPTERALVVNFEAGTLTF
jgi:hypothetical protein